MSDGALLREGRITPEGVAGLKALVGHQLRQPWSLNTEVTFDNVRHLCWGVGDGNPLWLDRGHATASVYGSPVAPPGFLSTIHPTYISLKMPGVHSLHAGTRWTLHRPLPLGITPRVVSWLADVTEREGRLGGPSVFLTYRTVYADEDDRVLAEASTLGMKLERRRARENSQAKGQRTMKFWPPEELEPVRAQQLSYERRGSKSRTWDEVEVGDAVGPLVKGPLCSTDMIAWYVGSVPFYQPANELALAHYRHRPGWVFTNPEIGVEEPNLRVHENMAAARSVGAAAPYDFGTQRQQWFFQLLTDWAGDTGFVKENSAEFRGFNYFGDVSWLQGTVTEKYVDTDGDHVVRIEAGARNQEGETTMPCSAVVALPREDLDVTSPIATAQRRTLSLEDYLDAEAPGLVRLAPGLGI